MAMVPKLIKAALHLHKALPESLKFQDFVQFCH